MNDELGFLNIIQMAFILYRTSQYYFDDYIGYAVVVSRTLSWHNESLMYLRDMFNAPRIQGCHTLEMVIANKKNI